jgi:hypothetical protein
MQVAFRLNNRQTAPGEEATGVCRLTVKAQLNGHKSHSSTGTCQFLPDQHCFPCGDAAEINIARRFLREKEPGVYSSQS